MDHQDKTKEELTEEIIYLRRRLSELEHVNEALQNTESRFQALFENMGNAVAVYKAEQDGKDFVLIDFNKAAEKIEQTSRNEVLGKSVLKVFPGVKQFGLFDVLQRVWRTGRAEYYPVSEYKDDRIQGWRENFVYRLPSGEVVAAYSDETEHKKAQESLDRANQAWEQTFNAISDLVMVPDDQHKILRTNKPMADALGMTEPELIGKLCFELVHGEEEPPVFCPHSQLLTDGEEHSAELVEPRLGGIYDVRVSPLIDQEGQVIGSVHVIRDITDQKQAEESLRESEELHRLTISSISDTVLITNDMGDFTYVCPNTHMIFGYSQKEVEALGNVTKLFGHELFDPSQLASVQEIQNLEWGITDKSGKKHFVLTNVRRVSIKGGTVLYTCRDITERRRVEEALQDSEERLRLALEASQIGIRDWDVKTDRWYASPTYYTMLGYEPNTALGHRREWLERVHPDDRAFVNEKIQDVLTRDFNGYQYEARLRHADGTYRWQHVQGMSVKRDEDGKVTRILGIRMDMTERKRAEQDLAKQVSLMKSLLEAIPAPVFFKDTDHVYIGCNAAFAEMVGLPKENIIGKSVFDVAPKELAETYRTQDEALFKSPGTQIYETSMMSCDGSRHDVMFHKATFLNPVGATAGLIGVILDITDRKRAEESLRESEARYRMLFNDSKDAVCITSLEGELIEANQAFFDLFGCKREEIIGGRIHLVYVNPSDRDRVVRAIEARGFLKEYPLALRKRDGKEMDCLLTSSLRRAEDGTILGYQGIIRDITEQNNLQKQLLQAQKLEAVGTLAGGVAHDFNNLLTVVMGFSEVLLAEKRRDHPDYADLQKIFHAAENGAELVQRLLMFSRKAEPKPVPVNLNKQIVEVEKLLRRTIPRMVDIKLELSADLPDVNADKSQMEQVLMNLAVNARDSMPDKGTLTVATQAVTLDEEYCKLHVEAKPGAYIVLEISDTGHGMDKETLEHIFEPFFTTKEMGRGTGLGLALVYGIVRQHNGHITVYSEVGRGTTFRVYLPAIPSEVEPKVADSGIMPAFGTETILLVDDEEFVRELGARILTKHGYTVLQAQNGREALHLFKQERLQISLVILDLIMPEMGGKECLEEILKIDPQVKVLVASGYSSDASVRETIQMGAKGFAAKPFRVNELLRDVRRVLDET